MHDAVFADALPVWHDVFDHKKRNRQPQMDRGLLHFADTHGHINLFSGRKWRTATQSSLDHEAAIWTKNLPGDKLGALGGQEQNSLSNVLTGTDGAEWGLLF